MDKPTSDHLRPGTTVAALYKYKEPKTSDNFSYKILKRKHTQLDILAKKTNQQNSPATAPANIYNAYTCTQLYGDFIVATRAWYSTKLTNFQFAIQRIGHLIKKASGRLQHESSVPLLDSGAANCVGRVCRVHLQSQVGKDEKATTDPSVPNWRSLSQLEPCPGRIAHPPSHS